MGGMGFVFAAEAASGASAVWATNTVHAQTSLECSVQHMLAPIQNLYTEVAWSTYYMRCPCWTGPTCWPQCMGPICGLIWPGPGATMHSWSSRTTHVAHALDWPLCHVKHTLGPNPHAKLWSCYRSHAAWSTQGQHRHSLHGPPTGGLWLQ